MALIKCPECNEDVSDSALKCPKCGKQLRKPKRSLVGKIIKFIFVTFNLLMLIIFIISINAAGDAVNETVQMTATDDPSMQAAAQAGATVGAGLGIGMIVFIWVLGMILLGIPMLLTKPKS